jgi:tRNA/rRNA methyltransferase
MVFWAYILRCADGSYYTGHTEDLELRVAQHDDGTFGGYTHDKRPVQLVWSADFPTRIEALEAERKIKGWSRAKKEALIEGDWEAVQRLSKRRRSFETGSQPAASNPPQDERRLGILGTVPISVRREEGLSASEGPSRRTPVRPEEQDRRAERLEGPIIVLVRPQLGENIGKAARAMLNFALTELRLVEPRDGWPNPAAGPAASGADEVLAGAQVFPSVAEAVADCAHVYATTVRKRGVTKPVLTPEAASREIAGNRGRSAILFGPERSGLETDDVALARSIITVPVNPAFPSLNLAQAVILCAYEWGKLVPSDGDGSRRLAQPTAEDLLPPAPQDELEAMIAHFETLLEPRGYFRPHSRATATRRNLRSMLTKPGWNHLEVRTLRGVLSALEREPRD